MRHRVQRSRLNRQNSHRKATVNSLVRSLVLRNRIQTTLPKAQVAARRADRLMTFGKRGDVAAQRMAFQSLQSRELVHRLIHVLAPLFKERKGGYTRIIKLMPRKGDAAPMALLEWVEFPLEEVKKAPEAVEKAGEKEKQSVEGKPSFLKGLKKFLHQPGPKWGKERQDSPNVSVI